MAASAPLCDFGWKAPDFRLKATDGGRRSLADVRAHTLGQRKAWWSISPFGLDAPEPGLVHLFDQTSGKRIAA